MASLIETGVDRLINIVKNKGRISYQEVAKELGVSLNLIEEWADFLEEEGFITIEYKLTKPYIVEKKLTKKDIVEKSQEFLNKKNSFVSKAETMLNILEKESVELREIKKETDNLRQSLGSDIEKVKSDINQLERYEGSRNELHKRLIRIEEDFGTRLKAITVQIQNQQKKYEELLKSVGEEENKIERERQTTKSLEEKEIILFKKLRDLEEMIGKLKRDVKDEYKDIISANRHTNQLKRFAITIKNDIDNKKLMITNLLKEKEKEEKKIELLQKEITRKIEQNSKNLGLSREASKKLREYLEKKMKTNTMIDKLNKTREELRSELIELINKAKILKISSKEKDIAKEIKEIENKFNRIDKKKNIFEIELRKFMSLFK